MIDEGQEFGVAMHSIRCICGLSHSELIVVHTKSTNTRGGTVLLETMRLAINKHGCFGKLLVPEGFLHKLAVDSCML